MEKQAHLFIILIIVIIAGMTLFSFELARIVDKEVGKIICPETKSPASSYEVKAQIKTAVISARPKDLGLKAYSSSNKPKTQEDWDYVMSDMLKSMKNDYSPQEWEKFKRNVSYDPERFPQQLAQVEEKIKQAEQEVSKDPGNQQALAMHEQLMKVYAMLKALPEALR